MSETYKGRTPQELEALLVKYMARVIDIESVSFVKNGMSYGRIEFEGGDFSYLLSIEERARKEFDL